MLFRLVPERGPCVQYTNLSSDTVGPRVHWPGPIQLKLLVSLLNTNRTLPVGPACCVREDAMQFRLISACWPAAWLPEIFVTVYSPS
jgi:hypothetical protein